MDNTLIATEESSDLTMDRIMAMKVADLKRELKARGLGATGNKTELTQRLQAALANGNKCLEASESAEELNEDDVLADDSLLNDEVKTNDIMEDDILDAKDVVNLDKDKTKPKKQVEKTKVSITRNANLVVPEENSAATPQPIGIKTNKATDTSKKLITVEPNNNSEKLTLRAKRFGVVSENMKLRTRVERFGDAPNKITGNDSIKSSPVALDVDRLKQRAARFGQVIAPAIIKVEEKDKLLKRKQRFGTLIASVTSSGGEDRKKTRLERFKSK